MIKPTVGRIVLVRKRPGAISGVGLPEAAIICFVHSDSCINVAGFDANGLPWAISSLTLLQDDAAPPVYEYAEWMPYQKGQAAKTEQLETQLQEQRT